MNLDHIAEPLRPLAVPVADLVLDHANARKHDDANLEAIRGSLRAFGQRTPLVVNRPTGVIIKGNGTTTAARSMGWTHLAAVYVDDDQATQTAYAIADNRTAELAAWDDDVLGKLLADVQSPDGDVQKMLDDLKAETAPAEPLPTPGDGGDDFDATPDEGPTRTNLGEVWVIGGKHRLMCGDSTDAEHVAKLMAGERAEITLTDPPYNVGIQYGGSTNDDRTKEDYAAWSFIWFHNCPSDFVAFTPGMVNLSMWFAIQPPKWVCAWRKSNQCSRSALGGFNTWEPILAYGKPPKNVGHDSWDMPMTQEMNRDNPEHPVAKTVAAWSEFLTAFSTDASIIYDPFLGSGTTLIAAHRLNRRCYGMEIEPKYADVILKRCEAEGLTCVLEQ